MKHRLLLAFTLIAPLFLHAEDAAKRPRIAGISQVSLFVHDLGKSRTFYKEFLGFEESYLLKSQSGALSQTWIKISDRQTLELLTERAAGTDRLNRISLRVDEAEAMRLYLAGQGVGVPKETSRASSGDRIVMVSDPDDHLVEFVQFVPDGPMRRDQGKYLPESRISARISHVGLLVGDLGAGLAFYCGILGGAETWRGGANPAVLTWVNVKLPEGEDYLEFILYASLPAPNKRGGTHHICLEVSDVEKARTILLERAARLGYTREIEIKTGVNRRRQINLFDPDGTRVEVMEPNTVDGLPVPSSKAPPPSGGKASEPHAASSPETTEKNS